MKKIHIFSLLILLSFILTAIVVAPPTPDPMTWDTEPYGNSASSVYMKCTYTSGSMFQFNETTGHAGATNSGWIYLNYYNDTGLSGDNTRYGYKARARFYGEPDTNATAWSSTQYGYTYITAPTNGEFHWTGKTSSSLSMSVDAPPNSALGDTGCYFQITINNPTLTVNTAKCIGEGKVGCFCLGNLLLQLSNRLRQFSF